MGGMLGMSQPKQKVYTPPPAQQAQVAAAVTPSAANDPAIAEEEARKEAVAKRKSGRSGTIATSAMGVASMPSLNGFTSGYQPGLKVKLGE